MKTRIKVIWGLIAVAVIFVMAVWDARWQPPEQSIAPAPPTSTPVPPPTAPPPTAAPEPPTAIPEPQPPPPPQTMPPPLEHGLGAPEPVPDRFSSIDRILETLELGNIAFNAPESVNLHDTAMIELLLGLETGIDELKQMIQAEGEKEGALIRVSDRMEARLSGPGFSITAITPEIQAVSRSEVTEWKWEIKPVSAGRHYLHLTLSALISVDGTSTPRAIRSFDKVIAVDVTWRQRASTFFRDNWKWLWAAVLVPLVGWLWKKRRK